MSERYSDIFAGRVPGQNKQTFCSLQINDNATKTYGLVN